MNGIFGRSIIPVPNPINPARSMPAQQWDRSIDSFAIPQGGGGTAAAAGPGPFDLSFSAGSEAGLLAVAAIPGTINSIIPSNIFSLGEINDTGTYYFVISATVSNGQVASATLALDGSAPAGIGSAQGAPPTAFDYLIGVVVDGTWYRSAPAGSLAATPLEVFRVEKETLVPGTLPYDIWYSWSVV